MLPTIGQQPDCSQRHRARLCRRISLLIHPDKCKHANAADAFEIIGDAQAEILDETRREALMRVLEYARGAVRETWRKATKHDSALRLAASIHKDGREGVERDWEETEDFHEKWRVKAQDVLARAAFRRMKLAKRCAPPTPSSPQSPQPAAVPAQHAPLGCAANGICVPTNAACP